MSNVLSTRLERAIHGGDEAERQALFPVSAHGIFLAHAAVTALPRAAVERMHWYNEASCVQPQEFAETLQDIRAARQTCASYIGAQWEEIALLGPTSLGLSLFANGLDWQAGDELLCYAGDYPATVYPWLELRRRDVQVRYLEPAAPGEITPELVAAALTPRTRLVALASAHFFTGYRIDVEAIGHLLQERGVLFSLDAIQTLGAFPLSVKYVDFLSADAHKWMLGPMAMGVVYVAKRNFERLRPTLLGAWNVVSPNFIAQEEVQFVPTAQRYEPGVLNVSGMHGMIGALDLLSAYGQERIAQRLLAQKELLLNLLEPLGFRLLGVREGAAATGITTMWHPEVPASRLFAALEQARVTASLRHDKAGREFLRFSPHFYNTDAELERVAEVLRAAIKA